jgi:hypothetical protein
MAQQSNGSASRKMAKLIVAEEKEDGNYGFRQKIVPLDDVEEELEEAKKLT